MKTLYEYFESASDAVANLQWRVYDNNNHGKKITDDYADIPYPIMCELDDAIVTSFHIKENKNHSYVAVRVAI